LLDAINSLKTSVYGAGKLNTQKEDAASPLLGIGPILIGGIGSIYENQIVH
jgi:hypothetical protein